jgi:hypothetical protein
MDESWNTENDEHHLIVRHCFSILSATAKFSGQKGLAKVQKNRLQNVSNALNSIIKMKKPASKTKK